MLPTWFALRGADMQFDFLLLVKAFLIGGILCVIAQILIDKTKLTPAYILVGYVCGGIKQNASAHVSYKNISRQYKKTEHLVLFTVAYLPPRRE